MTSPKPLKTHKINIYIYIHIWPSFGCTRPFGDIPGSIVSSSHFGKKPGAWYITICSVIFEPLCPQTPCPFCCCWLFRGLQALGGISFFVRQISHGMNLKSCLGTPRGPRYDHICKNMYFYRDHSGYQRRTWLIFRLSASKMTSFRVISVEDESFSGYQRRKWFIFGFSSSKMK